MPPGRTYGQQCGLAAALDLLGERWTLLIVRELSRGPKRFGDLLEGLDGIGTNLLSARLKSLEQSGVVERVTLPAPAEVAGYDLGERGRSLQPILEDLALWGFDLLVRTDADRVRSRAAWAAMSMKAHMDREDGVPPDGLYAFEVGQEAFWLRISDGESTLRDGRPPFDADVDVAIDKEPFLRVAMADCSPSDAGARIEGDAERLESLLETFRLPRLPDRPE
jgi:DNA-binding HxlR family transcriptional regulator